MNTINCEGGIRSSNHLLAVGTKGASELRVEKVMSSDKGKVACGLISHHHDWQATGKRRPCRPRGGVPAAARAVPVRLQRAPRAPRHERASRQMPGPPRGAACERHRASRSSRSGRSGCLVHSAVQEREREREEEMGRSSGGSRNVLVKRYEMYAPGADQEEGGWG